MSDFISAVGVRDLHAVAFHLPGDRSRQSSAIAINYHIDTRISEELLIEIMKLFKKYIMDDSVEIINLTSQALKRILSTEKGQKALVAFDIYEKFLVKVHFKGINLKLVEKLYL